MTERVLFRAPSRPARKGHTVRSAGRRRREIAPCAPIEAAVDRPDLEHLVAQQNLCIAPGACVCSDFAIR
jgi:hypothetical protein